MSPLFLVDDRSVAMKKVTGESRVKSKHQIKYQVSKMGMWTELFCHPQNPYVEALTLKLLYLEMGPVRR